MYKISVHPYVDRLLDYFEDKEFIYLILEKHQGNSLDSFMDFNQSKNIEEGNNIQYEDKLIDYS